MSPTPRTALAHWEPTTESPLSGRFLWPGSGSGLGWWIQGDGSLPLPALRAETRSGPCGHAWVHRGGALSLSAARSRLEHRALLLASRALLHEVNGKIMGLTGIIGSGAAGPDGQVLLPGADRLLVDEALAALQEYGAFTALLLRPPSSGPTDFTLARIVPSLRRALAGAFTRYRPVEISVRDDASGVDHGLIRSAIIWSSAAAHFLEATEALGARLSIHIDHAVDAAGSQLSLAVECPAWCEWLESGFSPGTVPVTNPAVADWLSLAGVLPRSLRLRDDCVVLEFAEPGPPDSSITLANDGSGPGFRCLPGPGDSLEDFLRELARRAAGLREVRISSSLPPQLRARAAAAAALLGFAAHAF